MTVFPSLKNLRNGKKDERRFKSSLSDLQSDLLVISGKSLLPFDRVVF